MMFKRISAVIALIAAVVTSTALAADIKVYVDNKEIKFDESPALVDGRVMVPVRAVFEQAGATVSWDDETRVTTLAKDDYVVTIKEGEAFLIKNGSPVALDVPASIINERLAIPVRAIAEAMDFAVTWNGVRNSVLISTDGKEYRANAQWKTGFHTLSDGAFVTQYSLDDINFFDLDGDGENDKFAFIPTKILSDGTKEIPALWIDGMCFNDVLDSDFDPYAVALADIVSSDKYIEIIVLYNTEDGKCAGVYRYNGADVFQIKANNQEHGMVYFKNTLFIDGAENIISDIDGIAFMDSMISTGMYSLEQSELRRYMLEHDNAIDKKFIRSYNDDILYHCKEVTEYEKGSYVGSTDNDDTIYSKDIASFELLDSYINPQEPSNYELYVEMPDGTKMVIWPYKY